MNVNKELSVPGKIEDMKASLKEGKSIAAACRLVGWSVSTFYRKRRMDPKLHGEVQEILKKHKRQIQPQQHLRLVNPKAKQAPGSVEWWEEWDDSAVSNRLAQDYPVKTISTRKGR